MEAIIVHPENKEQLNAVEAILKVLKVPFKKATKEKSPYNPEFVAKIKESKKNFSEGKIYNIPLDEIWK